MIVFTTIQILKQIFLNKSDFKTNFLHCVIFCFYFFQIIRFWIKMCTQKFAFSLNLLRKMDEYCVFCAFLKRTILTQKIISKIVFLNKKFTTSQILNEIFYNASIFDLKVLQRVCFWIEKNETRQISN